MICTSCTRRFICRHKKNIIPFFWVYKSFKHVRVDMFIIHVAISTQVKVITFQTFPSDSFNALGPFILFFWGITTITIITFVFNSCMKRENDNKETNGSSVETWIDTVGYSVRTPFTANDAFLV